ncbi:phospholipase A1 PLIP1, chloroplastic-like [Mangifera indica]|uniref:phospholipase A1 PLIP1, chloroplastic-like n=1 Tax=Mangifera indica TaxID=29780 RepID=UPI001CFA96F3|nr:phospholipase A1 PLIP1, chloroplastic-like [Mangifera indica]
MMAYTTVGISTSPVGTKTIDRFKENGLRRSRSGKDLCKQTVIRRSYSDNSLCYYVNRPHAASTQPKPKSCPSAGFFPFQITSSIIPNSVRSFLFDPETSKDMNMVEKDMSVVDEAEVSSEEENKIKRANWVERLMQIRKEWVSRQQQENIDGDAARGEDENSVGYCDADDGGCEVEYGSEGEEEGEVRYDRESFSRLLVRVPLSDTKLFSQLAFLCNMAYVIPEIKPKDLRRYYGIQFVTSSLEKKAEAAAIKDELNQDSIRLPNPRAAESYSESTAEQMRPTQPSVASKIAASAASYVQSRAKDILSLSSDSHEDDCTDFCDNRVQPQEVEGNYPRVYKSEVAAYVAASTMTAVVAAGEKEKQEAAKNLQSLHSSPCEWFLCDDPSTYTRCFVIQGSDSLASWQANLFFEPTKFEGTDALVHRGIYEAAKGIYEQFMPEIMDHLNRYGDRAKLQFTGHSLGGSLSLLVNLMLLTRNVVKPSALRPVVTFGSPFVFCGGQKILDYLGLDDSHVHCVMMHRDIVPRAFSCKYPNHVALVLKRLNGPLRSHPCLNKNKVLYSPFGKIFILQPDEKSSPSHPLLPPENALYALDKTQCGYTASALNSFLNCPHPLDTLSDPTAYGSEGTILRDHDSSNYLKAVNGVLRQHTRMVFRKARKQRHLLWPLLTSPSPHSWSHENNLQCDKLLTKEVMTSV